MRWACVFAAACLLYAQDSRTAYSDAVRAWNAGRIAESRDRLAALINRDPEYFRAYDLYWNAIARTSGEESERDAAAQALERFATTPAGKRSEDFYGAYERGLAILDRDEEAKKVNAECIERYPRGLTAQQAILDAARKESDPHRAAEQYEIYLNRFDDNVSWNEIAARDRFLLMIAHGAQFDARALVDAAAKWESRERAFIKEFGDPQRYATAALEISKALIDIDPAAALDYATKGVEFDVSAQTRLWPVMLEAEVKLGFWAAAEQTGAKCVESVESGRMFSRMSEISEESKLRRLYAGALDHRGKIYAARSQLSIAAQLTDDAKPGFDAYLKLHPVVQSDFEELRAWGQAKVTAERALRVNQAKTDLLGSEIKKAAPPFRLKNLDGRDFALADFRGQIVIAPFWAMWCGPCIKELEVLNAIYPRLRERAQVLAISIDDTLSVVAEFAKKNAYVFPILKSDGSVEKAYATAASLEGTTIPQLYVFDGEGNIRFHLTGFDDDGLFEQRLDWMIEEIRQATALPALQQSDGIAIEI